MGDRHVVFWDFDGTLAERDGMWPAILHDAMLAVDPGNAISVEDIAPWMEQGFLNWKPGQLRIYPNAAAWWASASATLVDACCAAGIESAIAERAAAEVPRIYYRTRNWRIMPGAFESADDNLQRRTTKCNSQQSCT